MILQTIEVMEITLSSRRIGMPGEVLCCDERCASIDEMRDRGVAQGMRADMWAIDPKFLESHFDHVLHTATNQSLLGSMRRTDEEWIFLFGFFPCFKICLDRHQHIFANTSVDVLSTLPTHSQHPTSFGL